MPDDPAGIRSYLDAAAQAERDSQEEYPEIMRVLDEVDGLFRNLVTGMVHGIHPAGALLASSAHAAYLAAASTALRGQSPPTFMVLRGCIESAMYAFLIGVEKGDGDIWLKRHENAAASKAKFTANRAVQKLELIDPNLAVMARDAYQWAIEFGGHPNPRSVLAHIRIKEATSEGQPLSMIYLNSADSLATLRCLSACIENACMAIAMICHAMVDHPEMGETFHATWRTFHSYQKWLSDEGYSADPVGTIAH